MVRFSGGQTFAYPAFLLGALALLANLSAALATNLAYLHIGSLFIFIVASSLGVVGALIASTVASGIEFWLTGSMMSLHLIPLSVLIGYSSTRFSKFPPFVITLVAWSVLIWPLFEWWQPFSPRSLLSPTSELDVTLLGMTEIVLTLLANTFLLNRDLWSFLTKRSRRADLEDILIHAFPLTAAATAFAALIILHPSFSLIEFADSLPGPQGVLTLFGFSIVIPSYIGSLLARYLQTHALEMNPSLTLNKSSFSGLSSEYWRRTGDEVPLDGGTHSQNFPSTSTGSSSKNALNASPLTPEHGVCALRFDGTILFANRQFRTLSEIREREVVGKQFTRLCMNALLAEAIGRHLEETVQKGPHVEELRLNELPQALRFFEISSLPPSLLETLATEDSTDIIVITLRDITNRRTLESNLLKAQKLSSLRNIVEGVSHSLSDLLSIISLGTGRLLVSKEVVESKRDKELVTSVIDATTRAGILIHQLSQFSEEKPSIRENHNLSELLGTSLEFLRRSLGSKGSVEFLPYHESLLVRCDPHLILQALIHILVNASESYPKNDGPIEVTLGKEEIGEDISLLHVGAKAGSYARIKVKDSGVGMSPETLAKAFDPLFTTKQKQGHAGLGLSSVFAILRAHDGFLTAESLPSKGTTVALYIPLSNAEESQEALTQSMGGTTDNPPVPPIADKNILVIQEHAALREMISDSLKEAGYRIASYSSIKSALENPQGMHFDLAVVEDLVSDVEISTLRDAFGVIPIIPIGCSEDTLVSVTTPSVYHLKNPLEFNSLFQTVALACSSHGASNKS